MINQSQIRNSSYFQNASFFLRSKMDGFWLPYFKIGKGLSDAKDKIVIFEESLIFFKVTIQGHFWKSRFLGIDLYFSRSKSGQKIVPYLKNWN